MNLCKAMISSISGISFLRADEAKAALFYYPSISDGVTMVTCRPTSAVSSLKYTLAETASDLTSLTPPTEVLLDPSRTWCPSSTCQAVCQLKESDTALPQLVRCSVCTLEFCSACKASWHPDQDCKENVPITSFLPGESRYCCLLKKCSRFSTSCP